MANLMKTNFWNVGDRVMVMSSRGDFRGESTVAGFSPKGTIITLANGRKFNADGYEHAGSKYYCDSIRKYDAEVVARQRAERDRDRLASELSQVEFRHLSLPVLQQLAAIVAEDRADKQAAQAARDAASNPTNFVSGVDYLQQVNALQESVREAIVAADRK